MDCKYWVYDIETICNCTVFVFQSYTEPANRKIFVIHSLKNDFPDLVNFLEELRENRCWLFGYNNLNFDSQIVEYILQFKEQLAKLSIADKIADSIYKYTQTVIEKSNKGEFLDYPEFKLTIRQLDIYKLNHWDSDAKRTSLKWVQYSMDWENVEEMPLPHDKPLIGWSNLKTVINYCINDVASTSRIFHLDDMRKQINLRSTLSSTYKVNVYSASEPRISKELFLHFLSEKLGEEKKVIKQLRTSRSLVEIKDVILPYVKFQSPEFCNMLAWFKRLQVEITGDKIEGPKHTMLHKDVPTDYGLGGLHGCVSAGIYEDNEEWMIVTADVTSFYPNLAIRNKWSPAHLPKEAFCNLYEWFFEERKKYDKKNPLNYLFKIILNSTYGLSKQKHSFLYDPELTFRITVNGQLLLSMLYEWISLEIPESKPLMQNTDGLEFMIPRAKYDQFKYICDRWEIATSLQLEVDTYKKMIIADVNNYIAVYNDIKKAPKCKGRFEWEHLPLHKNKSFLVVTKALYEYFINGVKPEDYLETNKNIYDYCAGVKIKGQWRFIQRYIKNGNFVEDKLQKLVRYYITTAGVKLFKCHPDGREIQIESGLWLQKVFNKFEDKPFEEYGINKKYYLEKIYQEIYNIEGATKKTGQISLF
jgi:hypothetical protein